MSVYNVLLIKYHNAQQLRVYSEPVHVDDKVTESRLDARAASMAFHKDKERTEEQKEHSVRVSKSRTIQNIYAVTRSNVWDYFITLTFDPKRVNSFDYDTVARLVGKWLNNLRSRYCPGLKYLVVPELHKDGKKWHIHALFGNCEGLPLKDSGKRDKKHRIIYNLPTYPYGFNTATPVTNNFAVCAYVTKYITKDLVVKTPHKRRVWISHNVDRPSVEKIMLDEYKIESLIKENGENIKHAQTKGDDLYNVRYLELENSEDILKPYRPLFEDGWEPCFNDWEHIDDEDYEPPFRDIEVVGAVPRVRDLAAERMRRIMQKYGRHRSKDESASVDSAQLERIKINQSRMKEQREELERKNPELYGKSRWLPVYDLPAFMQPF